MLIVNTIFRVIVLLLIYFLPPICARTEENVEAVNGLVMSQEDKPQTHRTVREISRETGVHRSSLFRIICKDLHLKSFKSRRTQELTLLLQKFPQNVTDFVFFTNENVFSVASPDNRQNKVSGRLWNF